MKSYVYSQSLSSKLGKVCYSRKFFEDVISVVVYFYDVVTVKEKAHSFAKASNKYN
jgi:hypothetical protein